jgi:hypothetical protein
MGEFRWQEDENRSRTRVHLKGEREIGEKKNQSEKEDKQVEAREKKIIRED